MVISEKFIFNAIDEVIKLLYPINTKITFLGFKWFCNFKIMKCINDKKHYFCIRTKVKFNIKVFMYNKKIKIYKNLQDYENLYILVCSIRLCLIIIEIDYTKNIYVKKKLNIRFVKYDKNHKPI